MQRRYVNEPGPIVKNYALIHSTNASQPNGQIVDRVTAKMPDLALEPCDREMRWGRVGLIGL